MPNSALGQTNPNSAAFGAQDITIGGQVWTLDAETVERMSRWVVVNDSRGRPKKQFGTEEIPLFTATLQWVGYPTGAGTDGTTNMGAPNVPAPVLFTEFTVVTAGITIIWVIEKVGQVYQASGESKINIGARYVLP